MSTATVYSYGMMYIKLFHELNMKTRVSMG